MDAIQLVTGAQMAAIDRRAINSGIPGIDLMEAAGQGIARIAKNLLNGFENRHITVLCGKGNNGGDGFVLARLAEEQGAKVQIFLFASSEEIRGDAKTNFERITHLPIVSVTIEKNLQTVQNALNQTDLVIDALLGTGINRPVHGMIAQAIKQLKKATCPILAVDVPSGLNADTGQGDSATATQTVTFACPRIGHFFYPGRAACQHVSLIDIGIPKTAISAENSSFFLIDAKWASQALPNRAPDAHKGSCGRVFILAGSVGLTGAAVLSSTAAVRSGSGLVSLGIPKSLNDILECKVTEVMTRPLPEVRKARCLALNARGEIASVISKADAVVMGPGLGRHRQTITLVHRLIKDLMCPTVLDADALNALVGHLDLIKNCTLPLVLTPHWGEFSRLTGQSISDIQEDPISSAQKFAKEIGHIVILKGAPTLVAEPNGNIHINPTGNAGMATGGSGDVLTGLIASLIGQGLSPSIAARLGVYVHGLAGDWVAKEKGQMGLTASDLVQALPKALLSAAQSKHPNPYLTQVAYMF